MKKITTTIITVGLILMTVIGINCILHFLYGKLSIESFITLNSSIIMIMISISIPIWIGIYYLVEEYYSCRKIKW
jgi:hypothetical protein